MKIILLQKRPATMRKRANKIRLKSFTGDSWHTISFDKRECDCEEFQINGQCEHLNALGIYRLRPFTLTVRPTFSQALSALVKSIRIRRVDEAVYWLVYLDTFKEKQYRFRTARRLLIGSAEDGLSIPVMEMISDSFRTISKSEADLWYLVSEAIRICRLPNWWHPESGGPDYIYNSLIGERAWKYKELDHRLKTLEHEIARAIEHNDKAMALGAVAAYGSLSKTERVGTTRQAEFILRMAEDRKHDLAVRLCKVHLSLKTALAGDNNFISQAVWHLAGGKSPVAEKLELVTIGECNEVLEKARKAWKRPHRIPTWCLDGVHSAGNDTRFMGMLPEMYACCKAFEKYGRIDPADKWRPEFFVWDGLIVEAADDDGETR